jgi:tetratricopeptide (TPR) repeat protein
LHTDILLLNHEPAKAFNNLNDWIKHLSADLDFLHARSTVAEALQESPATELDSTLHRANDLALIYHLGWTNYQQGKYPESLAWFHQFFEASREPLGFARYAELLWVTGDAQKAQEILNNGLEKYPNDPSLIQVQNKIKDKNL